MDANSFTDAMIDYAIQYHDNGRNYAIIMTRNVKYDRIVKTYGNEVARASLKLMGDSILEIMDKSCVVARIKEAIFAVITYVGDEREIKEKADEIARKLNGINSVKGNAITMRTRTEVTFRTQEGITDENIFDVAMKEIMKVTME